MRRSRSMDSAPRSRSYRARGREGIEVVPDLPDLRLQIARHQVVVLPFVSGGGIKNKLLEAAAMGKAAIVCSQRATGGLARDGGLPLVMAGHPSSGPRRCWTSGPTPIRGSGPGPRHDVGS